MHRTLVLAAVMLAAVLPLAGSAHTIPAGINPHNGYIMVNNWIKVKDAPPGKMPDAPLVRVKFHDSLVGRVYVDYGHTAYMNNCCFAAGTYYTVELLVEGATVSENVKPLLCNVRGIPFGYGAINLDGDIIWYAKERRWIVDAKPHRADAPCPTG